MRGSTWPRMLLRNKARFARHQWQHSHHHRGKLSILKVRCGLLWALLSFCCWPRQAPPGALRMRPAESRPSRPRGPEGGPRPQAMPPEAPAQRPGPLSRHSGASFLRCRLGCASRASAWFACCSSLLLPGLQRFRGPPSGGAVSRGRRLPGGPRQGQRGGWRRSLTSSAGARPSFWLARRTKRGTSLAACCCCCCCFAAWTAPLHPRLGPGLKVSEEMRRTGPLLLPRCGGRWRGTRAGGRGCSWVGFV